MFLTPERRVSGPPAQWVTLLLRILRGWQGQPHEGPAGPGPWLVPDPVPTSPLSSRTVVCPPCGQSHPGAPRARAAPTCLPGPAPAETYPERGVDGGHIVPVLEGGPEGRDQRGQGKHRRQLLRRRGHGEVRGPRGPDQAPRLVGRRTGTGRSASVVGSLVLTPALRSPGVRTGLPAPIWTTLMSPDTANCPGAGIAPDEMHWVRSTPSSV